MALTSGTRLGPYEIQSPLGAGGMGEVYRAKDSRLGRDVAIKVLPESMARDAERLRRFETEARAIAALNHPNILSIHDIGTYEGAPYLISECLEGQSLWLALTGGALPLRRAGGTPREVADSVLAADWSADGSEMALILQVEGKYRVEFPRGKTLYESTHPLGYLRIAPRGNAVAFVEFSSVDGDAGWVIAVDRNGKQLLRSAAFVSTEGLAWSPSGEEVWVGATRTEGWANEVVGLGFNGKQRVVLRLPGILRLHDVSRDGRVLLSKESWRSGLQFRGPADTKERDLSWLDYATLRDISTDGSLISFDDWGSAAGASGLAFLRKTDGSPAIKLGQYGEPVLSPDTKQVLASNATTVNLAGFALLPTGVGEIQKVNANGIQETASPGFMSDGRAIYYAGDDGHGWKMYIQDIPAGTPRAVTPAISVKRNHQEGHILSPDGRTFFARDLSERGGLYPLAGGEPRLIPGWFPEDIWVAWAADGRSVYVYHDDKTSAPLYQLELATGKRELITTLAPSDVAGVTSIVNARVTADGKTMAIRSPESCRICSWWTECGSRTEPIPVMIPDQ
jgi:hypothetical protein